MIISFALLPNLNSNVEAYPDETKFAQQAVAQIS